MAALNDLVFKNWTISDKQHTLNGRLWHGAISFTVFPKERQAGNNKPLINIQLDQNGHVYAGIMETFEKLIKSPLGTKIPISKNPFDPQTRTRKNVWVITFEKDQDMIYWITLTDCVTNNTVRLPITASQTITVGSEPPNKASLSSMGMRMFKNWLELAFRYAPMTAEKPNFGGRGPGGGGQRPASPAPAAAPAGGGTGEDDIPF